VTLRLPCVSRWVVAPALLPATEQGNADDNDPTQFSEMTKVEAHIVKSLQRLASVNRRARARDRQRDRFGRRPNDAD
jgi:hypothetical protein